jgi:hypothetical protein
MSKVFLYKDNREDRDCVKYIKSTPRRWECEHYFGGVILYGSCFGSHFSSEAKEFDGGNIYDNIEKTILSREEFEELIKFDDAISNLGYSIKKGDERYEKGLKLIADIQPIYNKLNSEENERLFEEVIEGEIEYLEQMECLSREDINDIFNNYGLDYRDRSVIGYVYKNSEDLGWEEANDLGYINDKDSITSTYFDYERFGEDLANNDEYYYELSDGRVVMLSY